MAAIIESFWRIKGTIFLKNGTELQTEVKVGKYSDKKRVKWIFNHCLVGGIPRGATLKLDYRTVARVKEGEE